MYYCTTARYIVLQHYYYDDVHAAHEAAHGLSRAEARPGPARVQPVPKRAEERFTVAMRHFPEPKFLVYARPK